MTEFLAAARKLAAALGGTEAAHLAAVALIEADALDLPRFGLAMLEEWTPDCGAVPKFCAAQSLNWADAAESFSPLAVAEATLHLARSTPESGIAAVFLRGVKGVGRLAPFVRHLADQGLVGIAGAEGPPFVAPFGGSRPVIGTNPLAIAMGQGASCVVIDVASSAATMADVKSARASGAPLRDGIALDGAGQPTTLAAEVAALLPRGGQVGSLLGLVVELLAGVAGGGRGDPQGRGVFLLAIDPARAGQGVDWSEKLASLQADWVEGGGHWPKGGGIAEDAPLSPDLLTRLDAHLARLAAAAA